MRFFRNGQAWFLCFRLCPRPNDHNACATKKIAKPQSQTVASSFSCDGRYVARIFHADAGVPKDAPWFWEISRAAGLQRAAVRACGLPAGDRRGVSPSAEFCDIISAIQGASAQCRGYHYGCSRIRTTSPSPTVHLSMCPRRSTWSSRSMPRRTGATGGDCRLA